MTFSENNYESSSSGNHEYLNRQEQKRNHDETKETLSLAAIIANGISNAPKDRAEELIKQTESEEVGILLTNRSMAECSREVEVYFGIIPFKNKEEYTEFINERLASASSDGVIQYIHEPFNKQPECEEYTECDEENYFEYSNGFEFIHYNRIVREPINAIGEKGAIISLFFESEDVYERSSIKNEEYFNITTPSGLKNNQGGKIYIYADMDIDELNISKNIKDKLLTDKKRFEFKEALLDAIIILENILEEFDEDDKNAKDELMTRIEIECEDRISPSVNDYLIPIFNKVCVQYRERGEPSIVERFGEGCDEILRRLDSNEVILPNDETQD